ncbi:hypothetical protein CF319_g604 [Tilletia indica]|uniref:NADAR domain-containing protein n=1 Tax=Tilletia indica TaxID=43049 RepID=A0A177TEA4_9BASI|nr:hypothetical protein CF319_g604 [Tilletia indica]KAE8249534.1 hypothetical protein A4X13_0g5171 [Tilletia indica]
MVDIEIVSSSELSSARSIAPSTNTSPIYFGVETEPFFFLSSLFPSQISFGNQQFLTAEALFQAARFAKHPNLVTAIQNTKWSGDVLDKIQHWTDYAANDWEEKKRSIMKEIQELKFAQNKELRARLLQTGNAEIIYRSKADNFFGCGEDSQGLNLLGRILMYLRSYFRAWLEPEPALLMKCFKWAQSRPDTCSTVWCANHASEKLYPRAKSALEEITITPAISDATASESGFLHGIAHGDKPWTLEVLIQLREEAKDGADGPQVGVSHVWADPFGNAKDEVVWMPLSSKQLKTSLTVGGGIYIYGFPLAIDQHLVVRGCTVSITVWDPKSAKRSGPDHNLSFILSKK